jgi:hypothetical protein
LLRINDKSLVGLDFRAVVLMIRDMTKPTGPTKGKMKLEYVRSQKVFEVQIERDDPTESMGFTLRDNQIISIKPGGVR